MIESRNIVLRTVRAGDIAPICRLTEHVLDSGEFWPLRMVSELQMHRKYEENGLWSDDESMLVITDRAGNLLGNIGFFKFMHYAEGYEIGYRIYAPHERGKGYMTEALRIFSAYLFELKPLPRLQVNVLEGNLPSLRVAEKAGYSYEGCLRKLVFSHGRYHNLRMYSLLREECPALAEALAEFAKV